MDSESMDFFVPVFLGSLRKVLYASRHQAAAFEVLFMCM